MNRKRIITQLRSQYPGKNIVELPSDNPTEIICEIEPTSEHRERSTAIAVIDNSVPHFHRVSVETYEVLDGDINLHDEGGTFKLKKGQSHAVIPGSVHWATGNSAWVKVKSVPGWTPEDHHFILNPKE